MASIKEEKNNFKNIDYKKSLNELIKNMNDNQIKKLYKKALYIIYKK